MTLSLEDFFYDKRIETEFDRKTIRKYLEAETTPQSKKRIKRGSKLDPYKPYLLEKIKEGTTNCAVLMKEIRAIGYEGKIPFFENLSSPTGRHQRNNQPSDLKPFLDDRRK